MMVLIQDWFPLLALFAIAGTLAGLLAGLLGVGGGIVVVPILFFAFQGLGVSAATAMSVATATSLLIIIPTSLSSIKAHFRRDNIRRDVIKSWSPFIVLGSILGIVFSTAMGGSAAIIIFGVMALFISLKMLWRASTTTPLFSSLPSRKLQYTTASVIGAISSIMGIGGGTLGVLALTSSNIPVHKAVGTSAVFGLIIALPGVVALFFLANTPHDAPLATLGFINWAAFLFIVPFSVLMAPIGVWLGTKLDALRLKQVFAIFLLLSGLRMIYQFMF